MKEAVGIIITNEYDQVLLLQRGINASSEQGKWESVGGKIEDGETMEEACERETMEELGVKLQNLEKLFSHVDAAGFLTHIFTAQISDGPILKNPKVCCGLMWVNKPDLHIIDLTTYSQQDFEKLGWIKI